MRLLLFSVFSCAAAFHVQRSPRVRARPHSTRVRLTLEAPASSTERALDDAADFEGASESDVGEVFNDVVDDTVPDANLEAMLAALGPGMAPVSADHRAGFVSIVGSPNVGKSTLMNTLLGENLSICTPKASTTRQRVMGIANEAGWQIVYSDTPGVVKPSYKLHEGMMGAVRCAIEDADVILFITDVLEAGFRDEHMLRRVRNAEVPVLVLINKVDLLDKPHTVRIRRSAAADADAAAAAAFAGYGDDDDDDGEPKTPLPTPMDLASIRNWWSEQLPGAELVEVSALEGRNTDLIKERLLGLLPLHPPYFDKSDLSDRPEKFFAAEFVRQQIFEQYGDEIPYSCEVEVTSFKESDNKIKCEATVHVMRDSQKGILIGNKATKIQALTAAAQVACYKFFGKRVDLRLDVRVSKNWRADDQFLRQFGYLR
jgi:GTP-binding protein Era